MDRKKQGDLGVAAAIFHYTQLGYVVATPLVDSARYDLVIDNGSNLFKVQVKSTGYIESGKSYYQVQLSTQGGNRTWDGTKKFISSQDCDLVFIYCLNGTKYEFTADECASKGNIKLGTKYDKNKV